MLAQRTIEALAPEMKELAERLGVSYASVKFWKTGDRTPSPENMRKLAEVADDRADELIALAGRLRRTAESQES